VTPFAFPASSGALWQGIKLQICRNTANWLRFGLFVVFIHAQWHGDPISSRLLN
jgi:hypothetical protein